VGPRPTPSPDRARRAELADFLKARRAALDPSEAGVPTGGFRRTPGLRREEVAQRAGVGLSWYTWLEQARDVTPSAQVLGALSRALELTGPETAHLFRLAGVAEPGPPADASAEATLGEDVVAIVHALAPHIAYVLSPRFDVLVHNRPAELILGDLVTAPRERRNLLLWLFDGPAGWTNVEAWEATARANLLDFRAEYARHAGDPAYTALVDELLERSAVLRGWWAEHKVQPLEPVHKRIEHPALGPLNLLQSQSTLSDDPRLRLRILVPADAATRRVLESACE
jgi:transcriptional regulator with XRE-family HTH domain